MRTVSPSWLARIGLGAALAGAAPAAHADEPCARVEVTTELPAEWAASVAALRSRIARLQPSDCLPLRLSVARKRGETHVLATAPDGRHTERTVEAPDDLVPVALGLLAATPLPAPPPVEPPPAVPSPPPTPALAPAPPPAPPQPSSRLWLGLDAGVRLTAPQGLTVLDVELRGDVTRGPWIVFGTVRSAVLSCLGAQGVDCDVYNDLSAGVGLARRVRAGAAAIDFGLSPSLVWMHMELDGATEAESVAGAVLGLRVDGSARLAVPLGETTALTVTVDLGVVPTLLASPARLPSPTGTGTAPPFPAYSGGVRLGFSAQVL